MGLKMPCFAAFRGMLTPSFTVTPWPRALGRRRECVARKPAGFVTETGVGAADDCERGVTFALFCRGGPRAQADFDGRGIFGVEAVEDLLILRKKCTEVLMPKVERVGPRER